MRLWLRHRTCRDLPADRDLVVSSEAEWREAVSEPAVISSVLWLEPPLFPLGGPDYRRLSHRHEKSHRHDPEVNRSYRDACRRLAVRIREEAGVGLADRFGERSEVCRQVIDRMVEAGRVHRFLWEGCEEVITEDNRFLLGMHYTDYHLGPHAVPMLADDLGFYPEKAEFERDVASIVSAGGDGIVHRVEP